MLIDEMLPTPLLTHCLLESFSSINKIQAKQSENKKIKQNQQRGHLR